MKLTWHIVAKDLRRLRAPLALWIATFLVEFSIGLGLLHSNSLAFRSFQGIQAFDVILNLVRMATGYLLVASLVYDDSLVGTTAFWPTRPISGIRLLGAKLLACLLIFALIPILVSLPWWLHCGFGTGQVREASVSLIMSMILPVGCGLVIAALTGSMGRYIMWTLLLVAAVALSLATFVKTGATHLFFRGLDVVVDSSGSTAARLHTLNMLAAAGGGVVVAHQFLTRRLARSLMLLSGVAAILCVEAAWWPLAFKDRSHEVGAPTPAAPLEDRIAIVPTKDALLHIEPEPAAGSGTVVFGNLEVKKPVPGLFIRPTYANFAWQWPDGNHVEAKGTLLGTQYPSLHQLEAAIPHKDSSPSAWEQGAAYKQSLKNGKPVSYSESVREEDPTSLLWDYYVEVPRAEGLKMPSDRPSCTIDVRCDLLQPKLTGEIPIAAGDEWAGGAEGYRILSKEWNERARILEISVIERHAAIGETVRLFEYQNWKRIDAAFFAINRRKGESAWPLNLDYFRSSIMIGSVSITLHDLKYVGPRDEVTANPALENGKWTGPSFEEWFSDASLGRVAETVAGNYSRKVDIPLFSATPDTFSKVP